MADRLKLLIRYLFYLNLHIFLARPWGSQTMVIIQGPGICWTTPFAEMILDWIRKVLE